MSRHRFLSVPVLSSSFALLVVLSAPSAARAADVSWDRDHRIDARSLQLRNLEEDGRVLGSGAVGAFERVPRLPGLAPRAAEAPGPDWAYSPWPIPPLSIGVHAVFLANDDGSHRVICTPDEVLLWVNEANRVYSSAGIQLSFDPSPGSGDWEEMNSTLLNTMTGVDHPLWLQQKALANSVAAATPTKIVAFFRWGPGSLPTGGGFSWTDYNFIAMPGFPVTAVCGAQNIGILAHEVGHNLGLPHTFTEIFRTYQDAETYFINWGRDPEAFEGDGRDESYPDPYIDTYSIQCDPTALFLTFDGVRFPLPRTNVMSYYYPISDLVPSQAWTVRQGLLLRARQSLSRMVDGGVREPDEGENHLGVVTSGGWGHQDMRGFLGLWSGDRQFIWLDSAPGGELTLDLSVGQAGLFDVYASFTAAPDFGIHTHFINGQEAAPIDLYADIVLVTGPVYLGQFHLRAGSNTWRVKATGSNPRAHPARHGYGLDYILLVRRSATLPARVFLRDGHRIVPDAGSRGRTCVRVEPVDGSYANRDVDLSSVVMASAETGAVTEIAAMTEKAVIEGDSDRNGVSELPVCFAGADLASLFSRIRGRETVEVTVQGDLTTGDRFRGTLQLDVLGVPEPLEASVAPNPLNPVGVLSVRTSKLGPVRVQVFDLQGRLVRTLGGAPSVPAGVHEFGIDGRADGGEALSSGLYFYRVETGEGILTGRIAILK